MQTHQQEFRLARMCHVLQVSRSGFDAWQHRLPSARIQTNQQLIERMRVLHQQTRQAYGARKMWHLLNRDGLRCGRHRVARLRKLAGIVARRRQRFIRTVQARHQESAGIPNRLNQHFAVSAKDRVWAADFTAPSQQDAQNGGWSHPPNPGAPRRAVPRQGRREVGD